MSVDVIPIVYGSPPESLWHKERAGKLVWKVGMD
jgi:hypothetical protein